MNIARMTLMVVGAGLILTAAAVLYYETPLRNEIPEGAAVAILLALTGLFVFGFASFFRRDVRSRYETVEHRESESVARPARPAPTARGEGREAHHREEVEVLERDF